MADKDTLTDCKLLRVWNKDPDVIDHWVFSHQVLPFYATIYGWDFRWVIVAVYVVETVENFVWCLEGAYTEVFSNTAISDPIHGLIGAILGYIYIQTFGVIRRESLYIKDVKEALITLFDTGLMVLCSAIFYSNQRNLDWLYLLFFPLTFAVVSRHYKRSWFGFLTAYAYVIFLAGTIFGHPFDINSFYSGWIVAIVVFVLFFLLYKFRSTPYQKL